MRSTFDELEKDLSDLRDLVASIAPVNMALVGHQDSLVRKYVSIRRRFDYAAFAVALYASFEKFIENVVSAYARLESRRLQYAELPDKLVTKHLLRTAEMLSRSRIGTGRYAGLREVDLVKNLFECLNGVTPYTLNEAAVIAHDSNLRASEIDGLFAAVGLEHICERVRQADALLEWYCAANELDTPPKEGVPTVTIQGWLTTLVERRNEIAHRGGNPLNLPGIDHMSDALGFIEAFSRSVFAIAVGRYLQGHHAPDQCIHLHQRKGDGPFKKGTVVVVEKPPERLFVGQPVFVIVNSAGARWGRIQSIEINDADVQTIEPDDDIANGIGIGIDFKCPKAATLIALSADDDVVWSPTLVPGDPVT